VDISSSLLPKLPSKASTNLGAIHVIDDQEARGFLFSYEKLFGAKAKSDTDAKNEAEGKETTVDRTRRLFYVTCSRAEQSLAVAAYSASPAAVRETVIRQGWFSEDEVEMLAH